MLRNAWDKAVDFVDSPFFDKALIAGGLLATAGTAVGAVPVPNGIIGLFTGLAVVPVGMLSAYTGFVSLAERPTRSFPGPGNTP